MCCNRLLEAEKKLTEDKKVSCEKTFQEVALFVKTENNLAENNQNLLFSKKKTEVFWKAKKEKMPMFKQTLIINSIVFARENILSIEFNRSYYQGYSQKITIFEIQ